MDSASKRHLYRSAIATVAINKRRFRHIYNFIQYICIMVRITESLIRRKSEHNELIIGTLEELSLHQEDVERIEHLQHWCRHLKILLLQSNLISRIENVHKLKQLEYLNLALNNIERIENLDACESLAKLDLTLNFIGQLTDVESLRSNYNLRELILTGNPCAEYAGYREYVIAVLPQLQRLDCADVTDTHRLQARHGHAERRRQIVQLEAQHRMRRDEQKVRLAELQELERAENASLDEDAVNEKFWKKNSEHCPETRIDISRQHRKSKQLDAKPEQVAKPAPNLFAPCGRPYCMNQAKIEFDFADEPDRFELNLHVYKFLDTSLIAVDVQPNYVRATIKGKIFQMALTAEVRCSEASSKRSLATGDLLIVMPKLSWTAPMIFLREPTAQKVAVADAPLSINNSTAAADYKNIVRRANIDDDFDVPPLV